MYLVYHSIEIGNEGNKMSSRLTLPKGRVVEEILELGGNVEEIVSSTETKYVSSYIRKDGMVVTKLVVVYNN